MAKYICQVCGYSNYDDDLDLLDEVIGGIGSGTFTIFKTIIFIVIWVGLWFIPIFGWILALAMLFIPISSKKNEKCPKCHNSNCLVPLDSPKGKELFKNYYSEKNI